MSFSIIATDSVGGTANSATSNPIDTTSATFIAIVGSWYPGVTADVTASDSKTGNTWNGLTKRTAAPDLLSSRIFWCVPVDVGSGHTFTISGTSTFASIHVVVAGGADASPFDQQNGFANVLVGTIQSGSVTPTEDDELVIAGCAAESGSGAITINGGFTADTTSYSAGNFEGGGIAYLIQTSATAANPTWDLGGGANAACAVIATFKVSSTPPPASDGFGQRLDFKRNYRVVTQ